MQFSEADTAQIERQGTSIRRIEAQLQQFRNGVPFMKLARASTIGDGIVQIGDADKPDLVRRYEQARRAGRAAKFVPASGAASRMFKVLHTAHAKLRNNQAVDDSAFGEFIAQLDRFAFAEELDRRLASNGQSLSLLREREDYLPILDELLGEGGMNYGNLPKGLLLFHRYPESPRTAIEEQLVEAIAHTESDTGLVRVHFTISPEHASPFQALIDRVRAQLENGGRRLDVTFSYQKASTDTIAVTPENEPFRREDGSLLFRPGGHGALIDNLNELQADILFIKNIDNVVPDRLKPKTIHSKELLAGLLLRVQEEAFDRLESIQERPLTEDGRSEIVAFAAAHLGIRLPDSFKRIPLKEAGARLIQLLNRPFRVCGMVRNEGEPGGGPFWVDASDGSQQLQIVELSQIDHGDSGQSEIVRSSTHFNPVDLVCGLRNHRGEPFQLPDFVDPGACFISEKSESGKPLKALELPGLWNGAMANWNTLFVEVPLVTFNPVKTINDLLRPQHQAEVS